MSALAPREKKKKAPERNIKLDWVRGAPSALSHYHGTILSSLPFIIAVESPEYLHLPAD